MKMNFSFSIEITEVLNTNLYDFYRNYIWMGGLPSLKRLPNATTHRGLWLAGDYTESDYPATIEGAVRSGLAAAAGLLKSVSI
jgi:thioredoxin reductase